MIIFPKKVTEKIWREHLDSYSKTLISYTTEVYNILADEHKNVGINNIYICPLCLENYFVSTDFGIQGNAEFSLDHVPPESLGGRYKILSCKKCNNNSGKFESELEKMINFAIDRKDPPNFLIPNVEIKDVETGESILGNAIIKNNQSEITFSDKAKTFNPRYKNFLTGLQDRKIKLSIPLYDQGKIDKALLKSAYLVCFIWWGYEFAFSSNGLFIRNVLIDKEEYPVNIPISWQEGVGKLSKGISLLSLKSERLAFMVKIELVGIDVKTTACILIPNPTDKGLECLKQINDIIKKNPIETTSIPLPRVLHRKGYSLSWNIKFIENN